MATTLKTKNSVTTTVVPTTLQQGELAVNITDKKLWVGNAATTPVQLLGGGADGTFTNISVSGVATFGAGTVSLPSITTTGDTNTGIFFPAADTIAFTEGGTEAMRIDSSGLVGIGTSSPSQNLVISSASTGQTLVNIINTSSNYSWNIGVVGSTAGLAGAGSLIIRDSTNGENVISTAGVNRTIALQGATSTTGIGITFPATQNASSNANTLDDYEEGTWTATLTNCGAGAVSNTNYVKVGKIVTARITINTGTYVLNSSFFTLPFDCVALSSGTFTIGTLRGGFLEPQASNQCYFATTDSGTANCTITYITT